MDNFISNRSNYNLEGKQFLIVDDDPIIRIVMRSMFNKFQNTIVEMANNGAQALDKLQQSCFDLVIMDLQMPVLNGYQAAKAIRGGDCGEVYKTIPILAVTADISEIAKSQTAMMDNVLIKPFNYDSLHSAIHHCLFPELNLDKKEH